MVRFKSFHNFGLQSEVVRRCWVVLIVVLAACGSASAPSAATLPTSTTPATVATTALASTTSTTIGFSRESRLAVTKCGDLFITDWAQLVAIESIGKTNSPKLDDAQTVCTEAQQQLKADNGPDGSRIAHMLDATNALIDALGVAKQQIASDHFLDPPCPNGSTCAVTVLSQAAKDFGIAVLQWLE